jgi:hypothetical protein
MGTRCDPRLRKRTAVRQHGCRTPNSRHGQPGREAASTPAGVPTVWAAKGCWPVFVHFGQQWGGSVWVCAAPRAWARGWRCGSMAAALQTRDTGNLVGKLYPRQRVILRCKREKVASPRSCISVSRGADWYGYALRPAFAQEYGCAAAWLPHSKLATRATWSGSCIHTSG